MSKFDNMKGICDELERLYDEATDQSNKHLYLDKVLSIWASRAQVDALVGFLGYLVEKSREAHVQTHKELEKAVILMEQWNELSKKEHKLKPEVVSVNV